MSWAQRLENPDVVYLLSLISHASYRRRQLAGCITWARNHDLIGPLARRHLPVPVIERTRAPAPSCWCLVSRPLNVEADRLGWAFGPGAGRGVPAYVAASSLLFRPYLAVGGPEEAREFGPAFGQPLEARRFVSVCSATRRR